MISGKVVAVDSTPPGKRIAAEGTKANHFLFDIFIRLELQSIVIDHDPSSVAPIRRDELAKYNWGKGYFRGRCIARHPARSNSITERRGCFPRDSPVCYRDSIVRALVFGVPTMKFVAEREYPFLARDFSSSRRAPPKSGIEPYFVRADFNDSVFHHLGVFLAVLRQNRSPAWSPS